MVQMSYPSATKDACNTGLASLRGHLFALLDGLEGMAALHMSINGISSRLVFLVIKKPEKPERPEGFSCL